MSLPPVFPATFYKLLAEGAKKLGVTRVKFAMDAARHYLGSLEKKNAPIAKALGSEELAKRFGEARSKIAKRWWSTLSEEERTARSQKAIQARWGKNKDAKKDEK